jgi:hypothetical protein
MGKPKRKKNKPGGGYVPPPIDPAAEIAALREIRTGLSAERTGPEWGAIQKAMVKAGIDSSQVARAVAGRDLELIDRLIDHQENPELPVEPSQPEVEPGPEIPDDVLRDAMRAFRKRVKLTKLDHESKLARSPLSSGKSADFEAILPPNQFPSEVWWALAARGDLESTGGGFYRVPVARREF